MSLLPTMEEYEEFSITFTPVIEGTHAFQAEPSDRSFKTLSNLHTPYTAPFSPTHATAVPKRGVAGRPFLSEDSRLFHTGHPFLIPVFPLPHRSAEVSPTALFCIALEAAKLLNLRDSSTLFTRHATALTREWATEAERLWLYDHDILSGANRYRPIAIVRMQELFPVYGTALLDGGLEKVEEAKAVIAKGMRLTDAEIQRMKEKKYLGRAFQYEDNTMLQDDIQSTLGQVAKESKLAPDTHPVAFIRPDPVKSLQTAREEAEESAPLEAEDEQQPIEDNDGDDTQENDNDMDDIEEENSLEEPGEEEEEGEGEEATEEGKMNASDLEQPHSHPDKENRPAGSGSVNILPSAEKAASLQSNTDDPVSVSRMLLDEAFKAYGVHLRELRKNRLAGQTTSPKRDYHIFRKNVLVHPLKQSLFPIALLPGQYQENVFPTL